MFAALRSMLAALSARCELAAAEARAGVSLVEAVAVNAYEVELRMVTTLMEDRDRIRLLGIEAAKLGLVADDLMPMASIYHLCQAAGVSRDDIRVMWAQRIASEGAHS